MSFVIPSLSLRLRLTLTYTALMAFALGVLGFSLSTVTFQFLQAEVDRRLEVRAEQVRLTLFRRSDPLTADEIRTIDLRPLTTLEAPNIYVQVVNGEGQVLASSSNLEGLDLPISEEQIRQGRTGERTMSEIVQFAGQPMRVLTVPIRAVAASGSRTGEVVGILVIGQSRQAVFDVMDDLRNLLTVLGTIALGLSGVVGWAVANQGLRPLRRFSVEAAEIAERRDFGRRVGVRGANDEVDQLATTINHLLDQVDTTLRTHREFVADASHELRNPLLALRTNLELLDRIQDPEGQAECLAEARSQIERISRLVSDLLLLAQVEAGLVIDRQHVRVSVLAEECANEIRRRSLGQRIELRIDDDLIVLGDEGRLRQVINNLLENAVRHTIPPQTVELAVKRRDDLAVISVRDTGEGIGPEHLPRIFDRFYRVHRSGVHRTENTGLGLAIVKHLIEAHGGRIHVRSAPGKGSTFLVELPLTESVETPLAGEPARSLEPKPSLSESGTGQAAIPFAGG